MKPQRARRYAAAAAVIVTGATMAGCGASDTSTGNGQPGPALASAPAGKPAPVTPLDAATVKAAESQGTALVYGNANDDIMKPILDAFSARYPKVKIQYLTLDDAQVYQRYLSESGTGGQTADVILNSDGVGFLDLVKRRQIRDYSDPNAKHLPSYATLAPGVFAMSEDPVVAVFNKALMPKKQQPTTLAGLAAKAASLKGKIVTYDGTTEFGYAANSAYLARTGKAGWGVLQKLGAATKIEDGAATMIGKLGQGTYTASYFVSGAVRFAITKAQAKVLNYRYLTDATPLLPRGVAVTKAGRHPDAGKLFVNFLLSTAGQQAACKGGFTPYRTGVHCPVTVGALAKTLGADNINIARWNKSLVTSRKSISDQWTSVFRR